MKLIINTSTLLGTGVTQVATSFINECVKHSDNEYHIFLSKTMNRNIVPSNFPSNFHFYSINSHPIYGIKGFFEKLRMKRLCKRIKPDCMFSVFGPSCWKPSVPHLQGYAYPHYVYPESPLFDIISLREKAYRKLLKLLHVFFLKRDGDYYVCETEDVSKKLIKLLSTDSSHVFTVSNTYNHYFSDFTISEEHTQLLPIKKNEEFRFLTICSPALHKNLGSINAVVRMLRHRYPDLDIKFVVTISTKSYDYLFDKEVKNYVLNAGELKPSQCPKIYSEIDALYYPTLLECFSAAYPESMFMKKPIVTSDLPFATNVCGDAALYFNPMDTEDIVDKLYKVVSDEMLRKDLINRGLQKVKQFDDASSRAQKYLDICASIIKK